jgi:hypothetical protein
VGLSINTKRIYPDSFRLIDEAITHTDTPSLLGYHTTGYMNALTDVLHDNPLYIVAFSGSEVAGFLPVRWRNGMLGPVINSLPFYGPNSGPILTKIGELNVETVYKKIIADLFEMANDIGAISVVLYTPFLLDVELLEDIFKPERIVNRFTQYLPLTAQTLRWPTRARRAVLRSKKSDCVVRTGTSADFPTLMKIYKENCSVSGITAKPQEYFYQIVHNLCPAKIARFTVAEQKKRVVACLITLQAGKTVSYNVPCSSTTGRDLQANSLLIDEAIHYFYQRGYTYWNWEASPYKGHPVYEFKKNWGSHEASYKIMIRYLKGQAPFVGCTMNEIVISYPYYFVIPFEDLER